MAKNDIRGKSAAYKMAGRPGATGKGLGAGKTVRHAALRPQLPKPLLIKLKGLKRVAHQAGVQLLTREFMDALRGRAIDYADTLCFYTGVLTKAAGRTTVRPEDVRLALRFMGVSTCG